MCAVSHRYFEGEIYHKRFTPKVHDFTYPFFMLDIDLDAYETLEHRFFSKERWSLFSFFAKDHFGSHENFLDNVSELLEKFSLEPSPKMRFITLPRVGNFVFNPISMLIVFDEERPTHLLVEVHNYNGGRIVYLVALEHVTHNRYRGESLKDMYVSPFLEREGVYRFEIDYSDEALMCSITYIKDEIKVLKATLNAKSLPFESQSTRALFGRHLFLTFGVVTRTLWQTLKLKLKGLTWFSPTPIDQTRRY